MSLSSVNRMPLLFQNFV